jgi:uncharacterized protein YmfQ (DUF2313 family)
MSLLNLTHDLGSKKEQADILAQHLPEGRAWTSKYFDVGEDGRGSTNLGKLLMGLGSVFNKIESSMETYYKEVVPTQSTQNLVDWELEYGTNRGCFVKYSYTGDIPTRRRMLAAAIRAKGLNTAQDMEAFQSLLSAIFTGTGYVIYDGYSYAELYLRSIGATFNVNEFGTITSDSTLDPNSIADSPDNRTKDIFRYTDLEKRFLWVAAGRRGAVYTGFPYQFESQYAINHDGTADETDEHGYLLASFDERVLECFLDQLRPAHVKVIYE